jgi:Ca-activated chloride channel family protein
MRLRAPLVPYVLLLGVAGIVALIVWRVLGRALAGEPLYWSRPWALLLLLACALLIWVGFHLRRHRVASLLYSQVGILTATRRGFWVSAASLPAALRIAAVGLLAVALAGPQTYRTEVRVVEGIDVMIVLDLSRSMAERDLKRDRLDAGQRTIRGFLQTRHTDRIGLVAFAEEALLLSPLTLDYRSLDQIVADLAVGDLPDRGTAIGDGLGLALAQLERSEARSRVVILLSDGNNTAVRELHPQQAKEAAREMGVRVFTVLLGRAEGASGAGAGGYAVDAGLLGEIAGDTGGRHFRAGDDAELVASFEAIRGELETTETRLVGRTADRELYAHLIVPALVLLLAELALAMTRFRRFP